MTLGMHSRRRLGGKETEDVLEEGAKLDKTRNGSVPWATAFVLSYNLFCLISVGMGLAAGLVS
jgi:hypothetical protein